MISYKSNRERAEKLSEIGRIVQADLSFAEDRGRLLDAAVSFYGLVIFSGAAVRMLDFETACTASFQPTFWDLLRWPERRRIG